MKKIFGALFIACLVVAVIQELFPYALVIGLILVIWHEYRRRQKLKEQAAQTPQTTERKEVDDWDNF